MEHFLCVQTMSWSSVEHMLNELEVYGSYVV